VTRRSRLLRCVSRGPRDRAAQRGGLRLHGKRSRPPRGEHLVPRPWGAVDRAGLVRAGCLGFSADGRCAACDSPCAGVFEAGPGSWGSRRMPVSMQK